MCRVFDLELARAERGGGVEGPTAGGCNNTVQIADNPQFFLQDVTMPTSVFVVLEQDETRGTDKEELHIGFVVLKLGGRRLSGRYGKRSRSPRRAASSSISVS